MTQITSPCIGVCKIDPAHKLCVGCGRSVDEIMDWGTAGSALRDAVWAALPARLDRLGARCRRLPWTQAQIAAFVAESLERPAGAWVLGVVGAVGAFACAPGGRVVTDRDDAGVVARTDGGRLRFELDHAVHALTFDRGPDAAPAAVSGERVVLAVQTGMRQLSTHVGLADLGPDHGAIDPKDRDARLFDLGLGRAAARFCVRTRSPALIDMLERSAGEPLADVLAHASDALIAGNPTRVVESALGRVEITTPIPMPSERTQPGSHTHLLPAYLTSGRDMPPGMELPDSYVPGAIHYPGPHPNDER